MPHKLQNHNRKAVDKVEETEHDWLETTAKLTKKNRGRTKVNIYKQACWSNYKNSRE